MNEIDWLQSLKSAEVAVPTVDVSGHVMRSISSNLRPRTDRTTMWIWGIAAALGLTASTAAGIFAFTLWQSANDPAQAMASAWSTVLQ